MTLRVLVTSTTTRATAPDKPHISVFVTQDIARASAAFRATPLAGESDAVAFAKTLDTFAGAGLSQSPRSAFAIAHTRRTYTTGNSYQYSRLLQVYHKCTVRPDYARLCPE